MPRGFFGLVKLLDEVDVFELLHGGDYVVVTDEFLEAAGLYRERDGVDGQSRVLICGVEFDVVHLEPELAHGGDEVAQRFLAVQLEVNLEMVRAALEGVLDAHEQREANHVRGERDERGGIEVKTYQHAHEAYPPQRDRGGKPLNLAFGAIQYRVRADNRDADNRRADDYGHACAHHRHEVVVHHRGERGNERHQYKRPQSRRVAFCRALAAHERGEQHGKSYFKRYAPEIKAPAPISEKVRYCVVHS